MAALSAGGAGRELRHTGAGGGGGRGPAGCGRGLVARWGMLGRAWGIPTRTALIGFPRALPWHPASSEHRPWETPIAPPVTPFLTHHLPHPFANHLGSAWGCCPCWEPLVAQKLDSFDFQSDFRPKVPSLPAGTPQVPALGSPPDKTLLSHSEKQPDCAYLSRLEGFMLGKDVFWEHSVSGLPVTNPRLPLSSRAEREGCWPCLSWQM